MILVLSRDDVISLVIKENKKLGMEVHRKTIEVIFMDRSLFNGRWCHNFSGKKCIIEMIKDSTKFTITIKV